MAIPLIKRDDTLDPAYFARKPRAAGGGGTEDLTEIIRRLELLEDCCDEIQPEIQTLKEAVEILNGSDEVDGSVVNTVEEALDKIIDGAPDAFDTLKEVADWIEDNRDEINQIQVIINQLNNIKAISNDEIDRLFV